MPSNDFNNHAMHSLLELKPSIQIDYILCTILPVFKATQLALTELITAVAIKSTQDLMVAQYMTSSFAQEIWYLYKMNIIPFHYPIGMSAKAKFRLEVHYLGKTVLWKPISF